MNALLASNSEAEVDLEVGRQLREASDNFSLSHARLQELALAHWRHGGARGDIKSRKDGEVEAEEVLSLNAAAIAGLSATYPEADNYMDLRLHRFETVLLAVAFEGNLGLLRELVQSIYQEGIALGFAAGRAPHNEVENARTLSNAVGEYIKRQRVGAFTTGLNAKLRGIKAGSAGEPGTPPKHRN